MTRVFLSAAARDAILACPSRTLRTATGSRQCCSGRIPTVGSTQTLPSTKAGCIASGRRDRLRGAAAVTPARQAGRDVHRLSREHLVAVGRSLGMRGKQKRGLLSPRRPSDRNSAVSAQAPGKTLVAQSRVAPTQPGRPVTDGEWWAGRTPTLRPACAGASG
jgi:hypothetical protein